MNLNSFITIVSGLGVSLIASCCCLIYATTYGGGQTPCRRCCKKILEIIRWREKKLTENSYLSYSPDEQYSRKPMGNPTNDDFGTVDL